MRHRQRSTFDDVQAERLHIIGPDPRTPYAQISPTQVGLEGFAAGDVTRLVSSDWRAAQRNGVNRWQRCDGAEHPVAGDAAALSECGRDSVYLPKRVRERRGPVTGSPFGGHRG
jgi:hypothetical protein